MRLTDTQINEYRNLKDSGVHVEKTHTIAPHRGDETAVHYAAKTHVAKVGKEHGYIANCECPVPEGDIDVCLWGCEGRLSYAVEIEHSPDSETVKSKLRRYVSDTGIDELCLINANELPLNVIELEDTIREELGLNHE